RTPGLRWMWQATNPFCVFDDALTAIFEGDLNEPLKIRQRPWSRRLPSARVGDLIGWSERQWP
ncbi:MAG TPA: hypothetical protein DDX13_05130, partial [Marinobacter adhaerens]|nr:hypothetical protein [Marinobacter adhaerens]